METGNSITQANIGSLASHTTLSSSQCFNELKPKETYGENGIEPKREVVWSFESERTP
jgi:hypothetical protein